MVGFLIRCLYGVTFWSRHEKNIKAAQKILKIKI